MKVRLLYLAMLAMLVVPCFTAMAQGELEDPLNPKMKRNPIYIGPVFGLNNVSHSVVLKTFAPKVGGGNAAPCPELTNGTGNGFYAGLSFEQHLGENAAKSTSSLIFRALYNTMPGFLESDGDTYPSLVSVTDDKGNIVQQVVLNSTTIHNMAVTYNMFTFEACYKINPIDGLQLGFTVGPTFDFSMKKTYLQKMNLIRPLEAQFIRVTDLAAAGILRYENNDQTIVVNEGDIPNSSSFRFGLKLGVQYEFTNIIPKTVIVPAAYYNFGVTNLSSAESWRVNAFQIGVDIRFALFGRNVGN